MRVQDVMSESPACCSPGQTVQDAAAEMVRCDCGSVPVVEDDGRVVGIVTDRDIACRCIAEGKGAHTPIREAMSSPARCCTVDDDVAVAEQIMAEGMVRRVPVVDDQGRIRGIVAQADIALARSQLGEHDVAEVLAKVSAPTEQPSLVGATDAGRTVGPA